jgi:hypothetical protein
MAGEGALFLFHGAFNERKKALDKKAALPGAFVRPVYFRSGMRYAVRTSKPQQNPPHHQRWLKDVNDITPRMRLYRSLHSGLLPSGPKRCKKCGSNRNIRLDHKNGNQGDIRRANLQWLCNAHNIAKGYADKRAGRGVREERDYYQDLPKVGTFVMIKTATLRKKSLAGKTVKTLAKPRKRNPDIILTPGESSLIRKISSLRNQPASTSRARQLKTLEARWHKLIAKKNPHPTLAAAGKLYQKFIGKRPSKVTRVRTAHPAAARARGGKLPVAKLATLSYLKLRNPAIKGGMIRWRGAERPQLLSHTSGRQYYFSGGNQRLGKVPSARPNPNNCTAEALKRAGLDSLGLKAKLIPLGEVTEIGYFERKAVEDFRPVEYYHQLGEENGKRPTLVYDPEHKQMHLVGGDYRTLRNGINN